MQFGNQLSLAVELDPLQPTWERRYAPEREAWAQLRVWIGGKNLCRHTLPGADQIVDAVNVPLAPMADWLVRSWLHLLFEERPSLFSVADRLHESYDRWGRVVPHADVGEDAWYDARDEWWSRHFVLAGADGAYLPDMALVRDGEKLLVDWARPSRITDSDPEFVCSEGRGSLDWDEADDTLSGFVAYVAECLRDAGLSDLYQWVAHKDPLRQLPREILKALPLYTGRSDRELLSLARVSDLASLPRALGLEAEADDPAASPITQTLRDLPAGMPMDFGDTLAALDANIQGAGGPLKRLRDVARDAQRGAEDDIKEGYLTAVAMRNDLGLDGKPVDDVGEILRLLEIKSKTVAVVAKDARMITGLREGQGAATIVLDSPRTKDEWGRRFEQVRALGHLLLDPTRGGALGAASSSFPTGRRSRRSGAFAAEFLLPRTALDEVTEGRLDKGAEPKVFERLMRRYGVGAQTAAYHLWNGDLLSSRSVRDQLIEEYAHFS